MIEGLTDLTKIFGVSSLFIGLSVAAFGTSAPEAAVSIKAALSSHSSISFGNILGSNIANIGLVLGLGALIWALEAKKSTIKWEIPLSLFITIVLIFLVRDDWHGAKATHLSRFDGIILLVLFLFYLIYLYFMAKEDRRKFYLGTDRKGIKHSKKVIFASSSLTILGIFGVVFGAHLVVENAAIIAGRLGISEILISVTVVALGTSLPEVATSLTAMKKNESDIAVGNIVGSNIFNILFVLGMTSVIRPIDFPALAYIDLLIVAGVSVVLLCFACTGERVSKKEGSLLLLIYIFYIVFVIVRR